MTSRRFYCTTFSLMFFFFFFFNDTATTEIYTLSLHDALPICGPEFSRTHVGCGAGVRRGRPGCAESLDGRSDLGPEPSARDRKSTRLNSSHSQISYAVFCLKKKKIKSG